MGAYDLNFVSKFWARTEPVGTCVLWTAGKFPAGYGAVIHKGKTKKAHRVAWEIHNGPIPKGLIVRHKCRNKACVACIELGTVSDNKKDEKRDGTFVRGLRHHKAKLTIEQIKELRFLRSQGHTYKSLADEFATPKSTIFLILTGRRRCHGA